jgi:RNA polymerase sigma-70 factor (ECF subfamily)
VPDDGADPGVPAPADPPFAADDVPFALDKAAPAPDDEAFAPDAAPFAPRGETSGVPHDAAWFEDLVRTHTRALHRYLVRRVGIGDADDLAADVLVVAWRRRDDVPDEVPLAWLYRTAGFVVANFRRKGRPIPVGDVPDDVADDDPAVHAVRDEQVREVLRRLSPRDRQIVLLNAWEGLAGDDLAAVLGIGRGGADAALSRARARLATAWSELA